MEARNAYAVHPEGGLRRLCNSAQLDTRKINEVSATRTRMQPHKIAIAPLCGAARSLLDCKMCWKNQNLRADLHGQVVRTGFYLRNFKNQLLARLVHERSLKIAFVVGEKDRRNRTFPQIRSGHSNRIVHFSRSRINFRDVRCRALRERPRNRKKQRGKQTSRREDGARRPRALSTTPCT